MCWKKLTERFPFFFFLGFNFLKMEAVKQYTLFGSHLNKASSLSVACKYSWPDNREQHQNSNTNMKRNCIWL